MNYIYYLVWKCADSGWLANRTRPVQTGLLHHRRARVTGYDNSARIGTWHSETDPRIKNQKRVQSKTLFTAYLIIKEIHTQESCVI